MAASGAWARKYSWPGRGDQVRDTDHEAGSGFDSSRGGRDGDDGLGSGAVVGEGLQLVSATEKLGHGLINVRLVSGDAGELCAQAPVCPGDPAGALVEQCFRCVKSGKVGFTPGDPWHDRLVQHGVREALARLV